MLIEKRTPSFGASRYPSFLRKNTLFKKIGQSKQAKLLEKASRINHFEPTVKRLIGEGPLIDTNRMGHKTTTVLDTGETANNLLNKPRYLK